MLEKIFHLKENHTDVKTELMAGVTTFMTMAYILAVNPSILSASGMDANAVLIATSLASFIGTALMALLANYPFALAPGMGLNAYFSYTVVLTMGVLLHFLPSGLTKMFCMHEFSVMLVWFMLGVMAFETEWLHRFLQPFSYTKLGIASLCFVAGECMYMMKCTAIPYFSLILSAIGIWFVIEMSKCICKGWTEVKKGHWLMAVSASSYIIYLFHTTFEGFIKAIVRKLPMDTDVWYIFAPSVIVVVAAGVVVPIVLHRYVLNRFKLTRMLFGL